MKRIGYLVGALALVMFIGSVMNDTQAQEKKDLNIKQIMSKAHKGGNSLKAKIGEELKSSDIPWAQVKDQATELVKLGKGLAKNTPKKGDKASWEELTTKYTDNAKKLEAAAENKDKDAALASLKVLNGSCKACHDAHK